MEWDEGEDEEEEEEAEEVDDDDHFDGSMTVSAGTSGRGSEVEGDAMHDSLVPHDRSIATSTSTSLSPSTSSVSVTSNASNTSTDATHPCSWPTKCQNAAEATQPCVIDS